MNKIVKIAITSRYIGFLVITYAVINITGSIIGYYNQFINGDIQWPFLETLPFLLTFLRYGINIFLSGLIFIGGSQFIILLMKKQPSLAIRK